MLHQLRSLEEQGIYLKQVRLQRLVDNLDL